MKSFDSSLNSLNPGFTDDSLYHVIESFQLLDSTKEDRPDKNKTDLDWFWWRMSYNVESYSYQVQTIILKSQRSRLKLVRQLRPESYFPQFLNRGF